jgi:hypothetical protein
MKSKNQMTLYPTNISSARVELKSPNSDFELPYDVDVRLEFQEGYEIRHTRPSVWWEITNFAKDALFWTIRFGAYAIVAGLCTGALVVALIYGIKIGVFNV